MSEARELELTQRKAERERRARQEAERLLEQQALALFNANRDLARLNAELEQRVKVRTLELLKTRDAALAASRAKSAFVANMSHELRTPLNAILGYSEMLAEDAADKGDTQLADDLQRIHASGRHLLELIGEILDLSKIEAGKLELAPTPIGVTAFLDDLRSVVQPLAERNENVLYFECSPAVRVITSDPLRLRQILLNLLSNACKFTSRGRVSLHVANADGPGAQHVTFEVTDTGIGIADADLLKLFREFSQVDESSTRRYGGTGLGLAIARRLARAMGGEITVVSRPGIGSTFVLRLPETAAPGESAETAA